MPGRCPPVQHQYMSTLAQPTPQPTSHQVPHQAPQQPAAAPDRVVDALVHAQLVDPTRRDHARALVDAALREPAGRERRGMSALVEVVAYLGTALVLAAGALFLVQVWDELGFSTQVGVVAVLALVMGAGGVGALAGHAGPVVRREPEADSRRRLAGTLLTGCALAVAFVAGMLVDRAGGTPDWDESRLSWTLVVASIAGLVVCAAGYRFAPTAPGMLGLGAAATTLVATLVGPVEADSDGVVLGLALLATALVWLALTELGVLLETTLGRALGAAVALWAAQTPVVDGGHAALGYALTALVAVAGMAAYLRLGAWPYLAASVLAITVVVPEAVMDWTDGGLGAVGAVLLTGVTLLLASLLGATLRSRRGV